MGSRDELGQAQRRQQELPAEVLGVGGVVGEVSVDKLLRVCQEEVVTELRMPGAGARGFIEVSPAHGIHQPPVTLENHSVPIVKSVLIF